jgi:TonB family protein
MRKPCLAGLCLAAMSCFACAQTEGPLPTKNGFYLEQPGIRKPHLTHAVPAAYPDDPKLAQTKYACVVSAVVGPAGTVSAVEVENAQPSPFDQSAMKAVSESTFSPGTLKGQPVAVEMQIYVIFSGDGSPAVPTTEHGASFRNPRPTFDPNPEYSKEARKARLSGEVLVSFMVKEDGTTRDIQVIRKLGSGLDEQAVKAVRQWRFEPAMIDGNAIPDRVMTEMTFRLQ